MNGTHIGLYFKLSVRPGPTRKAKTPFFRAHHRQVSRNRTSLMLLQFFLLAYLFRCCSSRSPKLRYIAMSSCAWIWPSTSNFNVVFFAGLFLPIGWVSECVASPHKLSSLVSVGIF